MFLLARPSHAQIDAFLFAQQRSSLSYSQVCVSQSFGAPEGFVTDHNRSKLGTGEAAFLKAQAAVRAWKMFDIEWLSLCWPDTPIAVGQTVGVLVHHFGVWSLNACRIVYLVQETSSALERFGFAYGTLGEHAESGEERFVVEWDRGTDEIWYDLYAFSRPNHLLVKAGYPIARWMQRRFAQASKAAMVRAVSPGR